MRLVIVALILLTLLFLIAFVDVWHVRANEYFGDGVMWEVGMGDGRFVGVIRAWGWYGIYGTAEDCRIVPLWSPVGDAVVVHCAMRFNGKGTLFSGWMDFREHPRPFCGGVDGFPQRCFGE